VAEGVALGVALGVAEGPPAAKYNLFMYRK
jgi:hypothetical protein